MRILRYGQNRCLPCQREQLLERRVAQLWAYVGVHLFQYRRGYWHLLVGAGTEGEQEEGIYLDEG